MAFIIIWRFMTFLWNWRINCNWLLLEKLKTKQSKNNLRKKIQSYTNVSIFLVTFQVFSHLLYSFLCKRKCFFKWTWSIILSNVAKEDFFMWSKYYKKVACDGTWLNTSLSKHGRLVLVKLTCSNGTLYLMWHSWGFDMTYNWLRCRWDV